MPRSSFVVLALALACGTESPGTTTEGTDAGCATPCGSACCAADQTCDAASKTCAKRCVASCDGKACGSDGCGGSCGTCGTGLVCDEAAFACKPCTPDCSGKSCGANGCGGSCGTCGTGTTCNGASCVACTPKTCAELGKNCGQVPDGCGGTASCGSTCPANQTCGGGGVANVCGCAKQSCASLGKNCGQVPDGCGGLQDCGKCTGTETCGGGGAANVCGTGTCVPKDCQQQGKNCGVITDGCSSTIACGTTCTSPNTCGGGGVPNVCGCTQQTDAELCSLAGKTCGSITATDGCGQTRTPSCGTCTTPETCGGGGKAGVCGCTPVSDADFCAAQGRVCGTATGADNCGRQRSVTCGTCPTTEICTSAGKCELPCSASNCASGCCNNGRCETGKTTTLCGTGGAACSACTGIQVCTAAQKCGIDPASTWRIQPVSATVDSTNTTIGQDWDIDQSVPDLYVDMTCPPSTNPNLTRTPVSSSLTPSWSTGGCLAKASDLLAEPYVFQLWDDDPFQPDDPVSAKLQIQFTEAQLAAGAVTVQRSQAMGSMVINLVKQ